MSNIRKSLIWAAAILFNAFGNAMGWIADDTAQTMFVIFPVLAVVSLNGGRGCWPRRKEA